MGPAHLTVGEIRRSRSLSTVTIELSQSGQLLTLSRVTLVDGRSGVDWSTAPPLALPPPDACVPVDAPPDVGHYKRADARLDPSGLPYSGGAKPSLGGYLRPLESRPIDPAWLAMAVDWFPPAAFVRLAERPFTRAGAAAPPSGVSVELIVQFHQPRAALGPSEWLAATFSAATSAGGLAVEHGRVTGPDGSPVAESFQTRWTALG